MNDQVNPFAERLARLRAEPSTDAPRDAARLARVERSRIEMMAQGPAIAATLAAEKTALDALAARLADRQIDHVVIAGCGDSWFAGMAAKLAFEAVLGVPCIAAQAFDYALYDHAGAGPGALVVGISSGGSTPAVMQALEAARKRGAFAVGMSNTAASPILTNFDGALLVHAERRGWPTQASTAAVALLAAFAERLAEHRGVAVDRRLELRSELAALPAAAQAVTETHDEPMREFAEAIAEAPKLLFCGAGPYLATASFGAAKIRELSPVHAFALPLEEMHHYRLPKAGDHLVIVAPDAASSERALDTALVGEAVGATMLAILGKPDADIETRVSRALIVPQAGGLMGGIAAAIPLHLLAYHFAVARDAQAA